MQWKKQPFNAPTSEEWKGKVQKDLKGDSIESFLERTLPIDAIDPINAYLIDVEMDSMLWRKNGQMSIGQSFQVMHDNVTNGLVLDSLRGGMERLMLANVHAKTNFNILLKDVIPEYITITFDEVSQPEETFANFSKWLDAHAKNEDDTRGCLSLNPFNTLLLEGGSEAALHEGMESFFNDYEALRGILPTFKTVKINASLFAASGGNRYQELAFALAMYNELLEEASKIGIDLNEFASNTVFQFSVGPAFMGEVAKLRAARLLIDKIHEVHGVENVDVEMECLSSCFYNSALSMHNNMVRQTVGAAAANAGGADALTIHRFDKYRRNDNVFAQRMTRNIQHLLREESFLDKVKDPARGARYFEKATEETADKAWAEFLQVESRGGFSASIIDGQVQDVLKMTLDKKLDALKNKEITLVGVNKYTVDESFDGVNLSSKSTQEGADIVPLHIVRLSEHFEKSRISS